MVARVKIELAAGQLTYQKTKLRAVMRAAGNEVVAVARGLMRGAGAGRIYAGPGGSAAEYRGGYKKGVYQASAPGAAPARITGTLARSFKVRVFKSGEGVAIRSTAFYSLFLEVGAHGGGPTGRPRARFSDVRTKRGGFKRPVGAKSNRVLLPRPFLSVALEQRDASIAERIAASIAQDIKFVRRKP